ADGNSQKFNEMWEQLTFAGKEHCKLSEAAELILKGNGVFPERKLAVLHVDTYESVIHALNEKFKEVGAKMAELHTEWEEATDKLKVAGKVFRTKDYLDHAHALGDYQPFYE